MMLVYLLFHEFMVYSSGFSTVGATIVNPAFGGGNLANVFMNLRTWREFRFTRIPRQLILSV
ncbi:MAG: hypothetical protein ACE5I8_06485, partial [Thermodesulfobacteriota bacterium]